MPKFDVGECVVLEFDGLEHEAEVVTHRNGWVTAMMRTDPLADYGSVTARLDPSCQTVCVPEKRVRRGV